MDDPIIYFSFHLLYLILEFSSLFCTLPPSVISNNEMCRNKTKDESLQHDFRDFNDMRTARRWQRELLAVQHSDFNDCNTLTEARGHPSWSIHLAEAHYRLAMGRRILKFLRKDKEGDDDSNVTSQTVEAQEDEPLDTTVQAAAGGQREADDGGWTCKMCTCLMCSACDSTGGDATETVEAAAVASREVVAGEGGKDDKYVTALFCDICNERFDAADEAEEHERICSLPSSIITRRNDGTAALGRKKSDDEEEAGVVSSHAPQSQSSPSCALGTNSTEENGSELCVPGRESNASPREDTVRVVLTSELGPKEIVKSSNTSLGTVLDEYVKVGKHSSANMTYYHKGAIVMNSQLDNPISSFVEQGEAIVIIGTCHALHCCKQ